MQWPIEIHPQQEDFHVTVAFPPHAFIGQLLPFTVRIAHLLSAGAKQDAPQAHLLFEISTQDSLWMLSGKQRRQFWLRPGEEKTFTCRILPVVCGYLPVPVVHMQEAQSLPQARIAWHPVDKSRVVHHLASRQIYVYPTGDFTSGCDAVA